MTSYYQDEKSGITIYHGDCLQIMKEFPNKHFDLCLTDPPYGFLNGSKSFGSGKGKSMAKPRKFNIDWDKPIDKTYFEEIFRLSKNQIIFGFEHFNSLLPTSRGIYCWDKKRPQGTDYSEFELIWTSFNKRTEFIRYTWHGMIRQGKDKIKHPTQKPEEIIKRLLEKHSNQSDLILDPFMGSGTTLVAAYKLGRKAVGIEISEAYCKIAVKRIKKETEQGKLF